MTKIVDEKITSLNEEVQELIRQDKLKPGTVDGLHIVLKASKLTVYAHLSLVYSFLDRLLPLLEDRKEIYELAEWLPKAKAELDGHLQDAKIGLDWLKKFGEHMPDTTDE